MSLSCKGEFKSLYGPEEAAHAAVSNVSCPVSAFLADTGFYFSKYML